MNAVVLCPLKMPDFHITIRVSPCIKSIVRLNNEQNIHFRMKSELSKKKKLLQFANNSCRRDWIPLLSPSAFHRTLRKDFFFKILWNFGWKYEA